MVTMKINVGDNNVRESIPTKRPRPQDEQEASVENEQVQISQSSKSATARQPSQTSTYKKWKVADLRAECARRGICVVGHKDDLVGFLRDNDAGIRVSTNEEGEEGEEGEDSVEEELNDSRTAHD